MADRVLHRGGFVSAVDHAVGAFFVVAGAVRVPIGLVHELAKARCVSLAKQIAGALPSKDVSCRVAPRRAAVLLIAGQKIQKKPRLAERPGAGAATAAEDVAEQLLGARAAQEMLLVRRTLVRVSGRHRDAVDAEPRDLVEKLGHALRDGVVEQRAIDVDPESELLGCAYGRHRALVYAFLAHRVVVHPP